MAEKKKNLAEKSETDYTISRDTAAMLSRYPYKHSNINNFGLAYQQLQVKNLVVESESINGLKKITKSFEKDFDILCDSLDIAGSTSQRVSSLTDMIFKGIENYNKDIPDEIGKQASRLLEEIDWRKFFINEFRNNFLADHRTLTTTEGEKIKYSEILSMTENEQQLKIFPENSRKAFMQRLVDSLEAGGYFANTDISVEEARQVFYGIKNSTMGMVLFSKAYRRFKNSENVRKIFLNKIKKDMINSVENNIRKNSYLSKMLSGAKSEQELVALINKNLNFKGNNVTAKVVGSKKSQSYQGTNKIDILFNIDGKAFGISSKNLKESKDGKWLLGTFHQAASTATLLNFLENNKIQLTDNSIVLDRLLIYLIANINSDQTPKNFNKDDVKEDISNIAKLYLFAFIGQEISDEINSSDTNSINNSLIISVPQKIIIPTFFVLKKLVENLENQQGVIGNLSKLKSELFDVQAQYVDSKEKDNLAEQTARSQKREALKEMPSIQNGELRYDNANLLAIGQARALAKQPGKSLAVKINFLADQLNNYV